MRKQSLSTGDLARFCQVTPATIVNWIRAEKLDVYTTPGGQYRMERSKFIQFLEDSGFPIPDELQADRSRRVLVIEDDPDILEMLSDVISDLGDNYEVSTESNGFDGLIRVGTFKPDVIVLDLAMPKMDGAEVCRRLRSNAETKDVRIIIVSALPSNDELVRKVKRVGIDAMHSKPINIDEFAQSITDLSKVTA